MKVPSLSLILWSVLFLVSGLSCSDKNSLTVVSYGGGIYQQSHVQAFILPFEKVHSIKVRALSWSATMAELKKKINKGGLDWQVVEVTDAQFREGVREGLFERLSLEMPKDDFLTGTLQSHGIANIYWGTVLVFGLEDFSKGEGPADWRDFWDISKFPGKRGLQDDPRATLEFALLADGVPVEALYPLDVDRAFRKLDELKPYVGLWWKEGEEPVDALVSHKIQMSSAWNGRVFAAHRKGARIAYSWNQSALDLDWWVIPRGAGNIKLASDFIAFASTAGRQADLAQRVGYGPVNLDALKLLPPEVQEELPTYPLNWNKSFIVSSEWWSRHEEEMVSQWAVWRAGRRPTKSIGGS